MKTRARTKVTVIALVCLLMVGVIAGSYAYWNQTSTVDNPFDTGKYGTTLTEDFKPSEGEDWQPGVEINKDVYAVNTGDQDVIARIRIDEVWTRKDDPDTATDETETYKNSADVTNGYDVYTTEQNSATDGLTALDKSVVAKTFVPDTNWLKGTDGWYYYKVNLAGGETSDKWMDSVELLNDADMGKKITTHYVSAVADPDSDDDWFEYDPDNKMPAYIDADGNACESSDAGAQQVLNNKVETTYATEAGKLLKGYSDSDYTLTVTLQTVQATQEAIDAVFGKGTTFTAPAGTTWVLKADS